MAEISPNCETKKLQEFIENVAKCKHQENYEDIYVAYSSDDVGEEKRIRPDIMSFEAKEIDVNLKKLLSQKEWRLGLWATQFGDNVSVPGRSFNGSSRYFAEF